MDGDHFTGCDCNGINAKGAAEEPADAQQQSQHINILQRSSVTAGLVWNKQVSNPLIPLRQHFKCISKNPQTKGLKKHPLMKALEGVLPHFGFVENYVDSFSKMAAAVLENRSQAVRSV